MIEILHSKKQIASMRIMYFSLIRYTNLKDNNGNSNTGDKKTIIEK